MLKSGAGTIVNKAFGWVNRHYQFTRPAYQKTLSVFFPIGQNMNNPCATKSKTLLNTTCLKIWLNFQKILDVDGGKFFHDKRR